MEQSTLFYESREELCDLCKVFKKSIYHLIVEASSNLPADVRKAIAAAQEREDQGTRSALSLSTIAENISMAETNVSPICRIRECPRLLYTAL